MATRNIFWKSLGRRIGDAAIPDGPQFDGDGDGFVTNPLTGADDVPAVRTAVTKFSKGVDKYANRMKKKYGAVDEGGTGDCYQAAMKKFEELVMAEKDPEKRKRIRLVHGIPYGTGGDAAGKRFGHAWVEVELDPAGDEILDMLKDVPESSKASFRAMMQNPEYRTTVYDYSNGRKIELPRAAYYGLGNIDPADARYYTFDEMTKMISQHQHYGPWE